MRAEFYRPDDPETVVATARWSERGVQVAGATRGPVREALSRIFVGTQVAVDDPAVRSAGTSGPAVFQPGSLQWFQAAARERAVGESLAVRFVPEQAGVIGWDPAGAYRTFADDRYRRVLAGAAAREARSRQPGETRAAGERGPSAPGTEAAAPAPAPSAAGRGGPAEAGG